MAGRIIIAPVVEFKPNCFASRLDQHCKREGIGWYSAQIPSLANGHPACGWALNLSNLEDWAPADADQQVVTLWRAPWFKTQSHDELVSMMRQIKLREVPVAARERMKDAMRAHGVDFWGLSLDLDTVSSVARRISHHLRAHDPAFQRLVRAA